MIASKALRAKTFLIEQVVAQARREGIALSDAEITMLGFAEETATEQELAAARRFDDEVDDRVYEAKISELLAHGYRYAKQNGEAAAWNDALVDLSEIDCYLIVMANQAGILNSSRSNSLLEWGFLVASIPILCFIATAIVVGFTPLGARLIPNAFIRSSIFVLLLIAPLLWGKIGEPKDLD